MKKKFCFVSAVIAGITLVACGGGNQPEPTPVVKEYDVSLMMTEALSINKSIALSNEDFDADITVKSDFAEYCMVPTTVYEVRTNGEELSPEQYSYTYESEAVAHLHIPSSSIKGDIEIYTEAKADPISVSLSDDSDKNLIIDRDTAAVGGSFETNIHLVEQQEKLSIPDKLGDGLSVICHDKNGKDHYNLTDCCTYVKHSDTNGKLTIPAKFAGVVVITGNVVITAETYQPTYDFSVDSEKTQHLTITPNTESPVKGEEYSFTVSADGSYKIPSSFDIRVGNSILLKTAGDYTIAGEGTDNATVTISGKKVDGNIIASGKAIEEKPEVAPVSFYLGGIMEPEEKTAPLTGDYTWILMMDPGFTAPTADSIRVRIGDKKDPNNWLIPNKDKGVTYNLGKLTIADSLINSAYETVHIAAKASNVQLLEFYSAKGDWASVEVAANLGYGQHLFDIGEESVPFSLNDGTGDTYRVRIIDFGRDENYLYGNKAGITFEFTSCISKQRFSKSVSGKIYSTYCYKKGISYQSELYEYLNTELYNALPFKSYVNSVNKCTIAGSYATTEAAQAEMVKSDNYLFPLSLKEMGLDASVSGADFTQETPCGNAGKPDGNPYAYYKNGGSLVKTDGTNPVNYWVRSPANLKNAQIFTIKASGEKSSSPARSEVYVAPAFCF
ncbi:MAG: DUF6273 domain-containing protein [Bacilli bacterium]|nr:DUF6273 domain-containing protein [Bacilli bacterium]